MKRGEIWNANLDPVKGSEQAGQRPCVIVSPDSMNDNLSTVIVIPLTSKTKPWPTRVDVTFREISGQAICEQIRTISKIRLVKKRGELKLQELLQIKLVLKQMLFE
jgi:mRNA interferase MazF